VNTQIIEKDGRPEWAVVPYDDYRRLLEIAEDMADIRAADDGVAAMAAGEEALPGELIRRLVDGEHPLRLWREHRGLSTAALAEISGLDEPLILRLEAGDCPMTPPAQTALAVALRIDAEDLATWVCNA
jgi:hypothetical protein